MMIITGILQRVSHSAGNGSDVRLVDEGQGTVLELPRENSLRVHVRELFDLERGLEARGVLVAATHDEQRALLAQRRICERLVLAVVLEDLLDLAGELVEAVDDGVATGRERDAVLRELDRHHDERNVLRRVGLGRRDTDLGACVDVYAAVRLARDGGANHVDDSDVERAALEAVAHGEDRVGRLAGLRDEDAHVVAEDGRLAVEEVGRELD